MANVTLNVPAGKPYGLYFYGHTGTNTVSLPTLDASLSAAYTTAAYGIAGYIPGDEFPQFTSISSLSGYILRVKGSTTITSTGDAVFPATVTCRPGLNFVVIDTNAVDFAISSVCNTTNTRVVYGTYDGSDQVGGGTPSNYFFSYGLNIPGDAFAQSITTFRAGSAYIIDVKPGQTVNINYVRKSQYIITDSGTPSYPGFIICCENGDRLTTGAQG